MPLLARAKRQLAFPLATGKQEISPGKRVIVLRSDFCPAAFQPDGQSLFPCDADPAGKLYACHCLNLTLYFSAYFRAEHPVSSSLMHAFTVRSFRREMLRAFFIIHNLSAIVTVFFPTLHALVFHIALCHRFTFNLQTIMITNCMEVIECLINSSLRPKKIKPSP